MALASRLSTDGPILRPGGYGERLAALRELTAPDRPGRSVEPLGDLTGRLPLTRRRADTRSTVDA